MTSTRIVFVAYGSLGDIVPMLAIATQMREDGYRVLFVANEYFEATIRSAGVDFLQAGTCEEQFAARETAESSGDTFEGAMVRYDYLIGRNYARLAAIIERLVEAKERVLVVTHGHLSPAFPICERLDVPVVLTYYAPAQIPDNREDYVLYRTSFGAPEWWTRRVRYPLHRLKSRIWESPLSRYNEWRRDAGFKVAANPLWHLLAEYAKVRRLKAVRHPNVVRHLALIPKWFADPVGEDLDHVEFTGFVFQRDAAVEDQQPIDTFIRRHGAPIVFTPGTAVADTAEFCRVIPETCERLNAPAILLSRYAPSLVCSAPLLQLDHVDLGYLIPRARLLVHHGGIGTLAQAVRAGIPQIIRPRMYDQPNNALRIVLNGLGGMLYEGGYSAEQIAAVYEQLCCNPLHVERLAYYRAYTQAQDGAAIAAHAIGECERELSRSGVIRGADFQPDPLLESVS